MRLGFGTTDPAALRLVLWRWYFYWSDQFPGMQHLKYAQWLLYGQDGQGKESLMLMVSLNAELWCLEATFELLL